MWSTAADLVACDCLGFRVLPLRIFQGRWLCCWGLWLGLAGLDLAFSSLVE